MRYEFTSKQQLLSGIVSFLTVVVITQLFDHEIKWALAVAVGIGTFVTSGFYKKA